MTATLCRDCTALAADIRRRHGPAAVRLGRGLPEGRNSLRAGNFSLGAGKIADSALFSLGLRLGRKRGAGNFSRRRREFLSRRREIFAASRDFVKRIDIITIISLIRYATIFMQG